MSQLGGDSLTNRDLRGYSSVDLSSETMCAQHPNVPSVRRCRVCGAAICATCDFEFPGDVHLCPTCATNPRRDLSRPRKKYLIWAYILGAWGSIGIAALMILARQAKNKPDLDALGVAFSVFVTLPALMGFAMGMSAWDRRRGNPPSVWGAAIWNAINVTIIILFTVIGSFM